MTIKNETLGTSATHSAASRVLGFEDALAEITLHVSEFCRTLVRVEEEVPLLETVGRTLARPIFADRDQPPFDRSTRDGFAVNAAEFSAGGPLRIAGQVRAGNLWTGERLASGEAIEIMTGAPVPEGADAIAMVEHVSHESEATIRSQSGRTLRNGDNIVRRGIEARAKEIVVPAGSLIGPAEIALAATAGQSTLAVYARPTVAIIATGDELVDLQETPNPTQIRNSNSYALAALVELAGGIPRRLAIARDVREDLTERIRQARESDLLLFSGGVSMGKYDLVEEVLAELDAEFFFTGVKMQPGKPVVFGRLPERQESGASLPALYFFGLPGNPISAQVTFHSFAEPVLKIILGNESPGPTFLQATLMHDIQGKPDLTRILPARLEPTMRQPSIKLVAWHGSGDLAANARANCYAVLPPNESGFREGDVISLLLR
jgi:molybdopterin molybdotransferase